MLRAAATLALLLAAPALAQEGGSPFLTDPDALDRRYGLDGGGGTTTGTALPPSPGAVTGQRPTLIPQPRERTRPEAARRRALDGDVVDQDDGVVQPGSSPFIRF